MKTVTSLINEIDLYIAYDHGQEVEILNETADKIFHLYEKLPSAMALKTQIEEYLLYGEGDPKDILTHCADLLERLKAQEDPR